MPNLTNKKIDGAKPKDKPYKISDAHGLYIEVLPSGSKSWRYIYKVSANNPKFIGNCDPMAQFKICSPIL